jgi:hypothetical protein
MEPCIWGACTIVFGVLFEFCMCWANWNDSLPKGVKKNNSTMKGYVVKECLRWNQVNEFRMNLNFPMFNLLIERNENMIQSVTI